MEVGAETQRRGRKDATLLFVREAPVSASLTDMDYRVVAVSPELIEVTGVAEAHLVGRTILDLWPGAEEALAKQARELAEGAPFSAVDRSSRRADGEMRWVSNRAAYWRDDDGTPIGYLFINQDVTALRKVQNQQAQTEALLRTVMDNIPATLAVQDLETGRFVLANAHTMRMLGVTPEEFLGKQPAEVFPAERMPLVDAEMRAATETGEVIVSEREIAFGPLAGHAISMKKVTFADAAGRRRMLMLGEDVTEARQAARALERAVAEAQAANTAKSVFLANMSHEIRTPLNGVMGVASALARSALSPQQGEMVQLIETSAKALEALLGDILDLARVEAGRMELRAEPFDLTGLVDACAALFRSAAEAKGVALETGVAPDAAGTYIGDASRLRQILSNLLGNAVKFTAAGRVRLTVSRAGDEAGAPLRFAVEDTGIGFTAETKARLFDRFEQADGSITRVFGGSGLGLSISRALAELMGGRLDAHAVPGEGATFELTVDLPRGDAAGETEDAPEDVGDEVGLSGMRILLAEDHPTNRRVVELILGAAGVELTCVENGAEAVEALKSAAFELVLMDLQMPVMDGLTAIRAIRALEAQGRRAHTPILALTANAMSEHVAGSHAAGADGHLTKPIDAATLLSAAEGVRRAAHSQGRERRSA
jgi:PAS domain S-box-containing protein